MPRRLLLAAILCLATPAALAAQRPSYGVIADTLRYTTDNPFRLYWLRGGDTIGPSQHERSVESHGWRGTAGHPELVIRQLVLDVNRRTTTDTFTLAPDGRVTAVDHRAPKSADRADLLLRLPAAPLRAGVVWTDTMRASGRDAAGEEYYEVVRRYRVARLVDTLGARAVADVDAEGAVRYRFGFWIDSAAGKAAWVDVAGPVTEHYLFDAARGVLLRRQWSMDLHGRGVSPMGPDTVPAGLRSDEVLALDYGPRARFLLAPLPGVDTAASIDTESGGAILLHTVDRAPDRITSSMSRIDGLVGVATVRYSSGTPLGYQSTWSDAGDALRTDAVDVRGDSIVVRGRGMGDTTLAAPSSRWGIADYAMQELLAPMLLAIPRDTVPRPFAVFRPTARHWDTGTATAMNRNGLVVVLLRVGTDQEPETLVFTPDGDYLFGENSDPVKARRVPVNAARQARLQSAMLAGGGR